MFFILLLSISSMTFLKSLESTYSQSNKILKYRKTRPTKRFSPVKKMTRQISEVDEITPEEKEKLKEKKGLEAAEFERDLAKYYDDLVYKSENNDTNSLNKEFFTGQYEEEKARFYATFARAAKCYDKPSKVYFRGYKFFSAQSIMRNNLYPYKTFIHTNLDLNRIIISIGGPRNLGPDFYNKMYTEAPEWIPNHKVLLEKEYSEIYYTHIRHFLIKKLTRLRFMGFFNPEYVFNGHGIGGSLAILAAFDMAKGGLINWRLKKPVVYSFGALRIGDASFATQINRYVDVWRITKQNDYLTRAPVCYYCFKKKRWECNVSYFYQYEKYYGKAADYNKGLIKPTEESGFYEDKVYLDNKQADPNDYSVTNQDELNKNVFEKSEKPFYYYGQYYTSAFNPSTKYYDQLKSKKDDMLNLYFNVDTYRSPHVDKYGNSHSYSSNNNNPVYYSDLPGSPDKEQKMVSPKIIEDVNYVNYDNQENVIDIDDNEVLAGLNNNDNKSDQPAQKKEVKEVKDEKKDIIVVKEEKKSDAVAAAVVPKPDEKKTKKRVNNNKSYSKYDGYVSPFVSAKEDVNRKSLAKRKHRNTLLDAVSRKMTLMKLMKPEINIDSNSQLSDLYKHWTNYVYFTPPLGRHIFYTYDGKVVSCKRTYFGASTCELQYLLPKHFYSIAGHNNYLGVDFEDCAN